MKHVYSLKLKIVAVFIFMLPLALWAQQDNNPKNEKAKAAGTVQMKELVIGMPKINEKNLSLITDVIKQINGLEFYMFCPHHNLVFIRYSSATYTQDADVLTAFTSKDLNMPMFIKKRTFAEAKALCEQEYKGF